MFQFFSNSSRHQATSHSGDMLSTDERLHQIRTDLAHSHPESQTLYTDAYLRTVLAAPDKHRIGCARSLPYVKDKLITALKFRSEYEIPHTYNEKLVTHKLQNAISTGSLYWHGYDKCRRPILWVHPLRKDWKNIDLEVETHLHVLMIEYGIRMMPPGVTTFSVIACTDGLGLKQINFGFAKTLLTIATKAYPDRLGSLNAGAINFALRTLYRLLKPLMPARLAEKINLMGSPSHEVASVLHEGSAVPDFFGGEAIHDVFDSDTGVFSWMKMEENMQLEFKSMQGDHFLQDQTVIAHEATDKSSEKISKRCSAEIGDITHKAQLVTTQPTYHV